MLTASSVEQASKMLSLTVASLAVWTSTGPCEVDGACVQSGGFPGDYGKKQYCEIAMQPPGPITVHSFDTVDVGAKIIVNGQSYYGTNGPNNVVPTGNIQSLDPLTRRSSAAVSARARVAAAMRAAVAFASAWRRARYAGSSSAVGIAGGALSCAARCRID